MTKALATEAAFFSVSTPSVFRKIKLPADDTTWTAAQARKFDRLTDLAERHGTSVRQSSYQLG